MSKSLTGQSVEEIVAHSQVLTGKSSLITADNFPLRPIRHGLEIISPRQHLNLTGWRKLGFEELMEAMRRRRYAPAHLAELLHHAETDWPRYTPVWALGQLGQVIRHRQKVVFVPKLWSFGGRHDLGTTDEDHLWSDTDAFLVIKE